MKRVRSAPGGPDALRTGRIVPTFLRFFATTFAALFFGALYNLADALFVSRGVGDDAMGAVSVVLPFTILQGAAAQAIGGGAASIVSRCLGRGDRQAAGRATVTAMALFYGIAVLVSALGLLFTEPLLRLFGATDALLPMAREYFVVLLWGNVFSTGFSSIIRAEGKMRYALLIWLIPTSADMLLNAVFIFGLGLGVRGAALSTVIGQAVSFCMAVLFFARFSGQDFRAVRPSQGFLPQIALLGLPVLVQMGGMSVITFVVNRLLGDVAGTQGVNTFAYVVRLASFGIMPFTAAAQAASPMIGFYLGAGARQRVKKTAVTACTVCALWAVLALLAVQVFPGVLMRVFTNSTDLVALGAQALRTVSPAILFVFLPLLFGEFFQSAGKMAGALFLNALPVVCVPFFAWFLSARFGTSGIWWAFVLGCACACLFGALYAGFAVRKHSAAT